jgi:serine/threonine-protein kinase
MCTGRPAFRAPTTVAVIRRVCDEAPRPIREVNPDVPEPLCRVIERLHAKRPAERFQTAAGVAELLSRHLAQLQQPEMLPREPLAESLGASVPPRKPTRVRRRLAACAALVALGVVAACWFWWRPDEQTGDTAPKAPPASTPALPAPEGLARALPAPEELASRAAPADALRREDIPAELLQMAGGGDKDLAPPELVAVFGEDRHAGGTGGITSTAWPSARTARRLPSAGPTRSSD